VGSRKWFSSPETGLYRCINTVELLVVLDCPLHRGPRRKCPAKTLCLKSQDSQDAGRRSWHSAEQHAKHSCFVFIGTTLTALFCTQ